MLRSTSLPARAGARRAPGPLPLGALALGFVAFGAVFLAARPAAAQATYNGSLYSRYGLGDLASPATPQGFALGGGGTALTSLTYAGFDNPAGLANQVLTRITFDGTLLGTELRDADARVGQRSEIQLGAVGITFPLVRQKVGVGLRYAPYTRVSYAARRSEERYDLPEGPDTVRYTVGFEGSGGLQLLDAGAGVAVGRHLTLGATAGLLFGVLDEGRRTSYTNATFAEVNFANSTRLAGFAASVGALARFDSLGGRGRALHVGARLGLPVTLHGRRTRLLGDPNDLAVDTLSFSDRGTVEVPLSAAAGLAYYAGPRWTLVADGRYEPWADFESTFPFEGFAPAGASRFANRSRVSGGVEFLPAGDRFFTSFWERVTYRLGGYYDTGYVTQPTATGASGDRLAALAVTGGLSLPALLPGSRLDLGLEVGQRGEAVGALVRDRFLKFNVALTLGERWFDRPRFR